MSFLVKTFEAGPRIRRHAILHVALVWVPLLVLPIAVNQDSTAAVRVAAASHGLERGAALRRARLDAPLLQRWYSSLDNRSSADPYWLYSASNIGSFAALLAFPIVLEPAIPLGRQTVLWQAAYAVVAALSPA